MGPRGGLGVSWFYPCSWLHVICKPCNGVAPEALCLQGGSHGVWGGIASGSQHRPSCPYLVPAPPLPHSTATTWTCLRVRRGPWGWVGQRWGLAWGWLHTRAHLHRRTRYAHAHAHVHTTRISHFRLHMRPRRRSHPPVLWLEDYLVRWPKTLLVVSHAREFLNAVCTDVLHLHSRTITTYK